MKLPLITLQDENDFQWLAIGALGMLLIVLIALIVVMARSLRRDRRRAEAMEDAKSRWPPPPWWQNPEDPKP
jgi:hypothetical protein